MKLYWWTDLLRYFSFIRVDIQFKLNRIFKKINYLLNCINFLYQFIFWLMIYLLPLILQIFQIFRKSRFMIMKRTREIILYFILPKLLFTNFAKILIDLLSLLIDLISFKMTSLLWNLSFIIFEFQRSQDFQI